MLRLKLAALNPADRYLAEVMYPARPALPHILGRDGFGIVESLGPNAAEWKAGDPRGKLKSVYPQIIV